MRPPTPADELGATARELSASGEGEPPASFPRIVDKVPVDPPVYLDQTSIAELAAAEPRCSLKCIQAALDRADYDDAAARALAGLQLELDLPASLAAEVLVGVRQLEVFLVLGKRATGAIGAPLLEVIRRERFGADNGALDQITWAAFVLAQFGQLESLRTTAASSIKSSTKNCERPAAAATRGSSGTTLVQRAGSDAMYPEPWR